MMEFNVGDLVQVKDNSYTGDMDIDCFTRGEIGIVLKKGKGDSYKVKFSQEVADKCFAGALIPYENRNYAFNEIYIPAEYLELLVEVE